MEPVAWGPETPPHLSPLPDRDFKRISCWRQANAYGHEDVQKDGAQEVTGNADGGAADHQAALRAKDARIAEL